MSDYATLVTNPLKAVYGQALIGISLCVLAGEEPSSEAGVSEVIMSSCVALRFGNGSVVLSAGWENTLRNPDGSYHIQVDSVVGEQLPSVVPTMDWVDMTSYYLWQNIIGTKLMSIDSIEVCGSPQGIIFVFPSMELCLVLASSHEGVFYLGDSNELLITYLPSNLLDGVESVRTRIFDST
jgi:hypothetical protein